jgi:dienelactone hydrolase
VTSTGPTLHLASARGDERAIALLLHGGAELGHDPVDAWSGPVVRMRPFGWAIRRRTPEIGIARLRFGQRGWNGTAASPVADVEHALAELRRRRPGIPVVLVGHSMGGRAAVRAAGDQSVLGVVALAPWLPPDEPEDQLAGRDLVILHGTDDQRTSPERSAQYAERVEGVARSVRYVAIPGGDHAMLRPWRTWHREAANAVTAIADR